MWTAHLPHNSDEEKKKVKEFEDYVRNSRGVFDRVVQILETYMEPNEVAVKDYDSPSWAHKQADRNGYNRCLNKVKKPFS